ncbi:pilus assembly protein [Fodinicola feengrottensis]|uniref:pilus assembly protein n=1 Tax=Fodinicola feengrottensis TaxID=435914 RepID=UPI0013D33437|nr:pilus assembly protein [Fodinicola feengrottensis]
MITNESERHSGSETRTQRQVLRRLRAEDGSTEVELPILASVFLALLMMVVFCGRGVATRNFGSPPLQETPRAPRPWRVRRQPHASKPRVVAETSLRDQGIRCQNSHIDVDLTQFNPGGTVTVIFECDVPFQDLAILGVPAAIPLTGRGSSPVDQWRSRGN